MKDIKDYLHLYFGAICEITWTEECCEEMGFEDGLHRIDGVLLDNLEGIESGKIHVRPLSDMKEEEAVEYLLMKYNAVNKIIVQREQNGFWFVWNQDDMPMVIDKRKFIFYTQIKDHAYPEQFIFLLSKVFDLFGLIEAGLAIDKTKL